MPDDDMPSLDLPTSGVDVPEPVAPPPVLAASYRVSPLGRWHAAPVLGLAVLNLVVLAGAAASGVGLALVPAAVVLGGVAVAIVWFWGVKIATTLDFDGAVVRWTSVLRRGEIPVGELAVIRPSRAQFRLVVFERVDGRGCLVLGGPPLAAFVAALRHVRPDLAVDLPALGARPRGQR